MLGSEVARPLRAFAALTTGVGTVSYHEWRQCMFRLKTLALFSAVILITSFPGGLLAQDDNADGQPCRSVGDATASPSASPMATRDATPEASPDAEACTIDIRDLAFIPAQTEVAVGTTVTWTNSDTVPHTATATDRSFDSSILDPGQSFSYTFEEAGTFDYTCLVHPQMEGTIVVR
jgi:plastocyanin